MFYRIIEQHPFLGRGFRPFFAAGASFSILSVLAWASFMTGWTAQPGIFTDPVLWHAHEMIFGFTASVISGFLLTAVANWTGWSPVRGVHLLLLVCLWLAGRILFVLPHAPLWLVAIVDCLFIPSLAVSLLVPLWKGDNIRNLVFLVLLSALTACNIAFFIMQDRKPLYVALLVIMMIVSVIAGRIIPAFSVSWLRLQGQEVYQKNTEWLDKGVFALSFLLVILAATVGVAERISGAVFFILALVHAARGVRYYPVLTRKEPTLWILHAGLWWMITGFVLLGLSAFGMVPQSAGFHALTTGTIGSLTIGMMCRVAMGHTGMKIEAGKMTVIAFALMQAAALVRVAGPIALPQFFQYWIGISGSLWALCFVIYLGVYGAVLWRPRKDGLPA